MTIIITITFITKKTNFDKKTNKHTDTTHKQIKCKTKLDKQDKQKRMKDDITNICRHSSLHNNKTNNTLIYYITILIQMQTGKTSTTIADNLRSRGKIGEGCSKRKNDDEAYYRNTTKQQKQDEMRSPIVSSTSRTPARSNSKIPTPTTRGRTPETPFSTPYSSPQRFITENNREQSEAQNKEKLWQDNIETRTKKITQQIQALKQKQQAKQDQKTWSLIPLPPDQIFTPPLPREAETIETAENQIEALISQDKPEETESVTATEKKGEEAKDPEPEKRKIQGNKNKSSKRKKNNKDSDPEDSSDSSSDDENGEESENYEDAEDGNEEEEEEDNTDENEEEENEDGEENNEEENNDDDDPEQQEINKTVQEQEKARKEKADKLKASRAAERKSWFQDDKVYKMKYDEALKTGTLCEIRTTDIQHRMDQKDFEHVSVNITILLDEALKRSNSIKTGKYGITYSCIWIQVKNNETMDYLKNNVHLIPKCDDRDYSYIVSNERPNRIVTAFVKEGLWADSQTLLRRIRSYTDSLDYTVTNEDSTTRLPAIAIREGGLKSKDEELKDPEGNARKFFKLTLEIEEEGIKRIVNNPDKHNVGKIAVSPFDWVLITGSGVEGMTRKKRLADRIASGLAKKKKKTTKKTTQKPRKTSNTKKTKSGQKKPKNIPLTSTPNKNHGSE